MPRSNEPLGEIASEVLFENDKVKVWNLVVEPGEASDWHMHDNDYVTVVVEGEGLMVQYEDGAEQDSPSEVGTWRFHGEHKIHRVVNNRDVRYKNVLIELKS